MLNRGFTFIEMTIALSLIAVLAALALPSFMQLLQQNEAHVLQQQLLHTIEFAREAARVRHETIGVCGSADGITCGGAWEKGQLVFVDNQHGVVRALNQIINVQQLSRMTGKLYWRGFSHTYVRFDAEIFTNDTNGTFWYCASRNIKPTWAIVLNKAARARVIMPDKNGEIEDGFNKPLRC